MKKVRDYSILIGDDDLIPRSEWVPLSEMNTDTRIIEHDIFEEAFVKIVEEHQVTKPIAFLSLCTRSRPYSDSFKWKNFEQYGDVSDLIVVSTSGVVPQRYWNSYPFLNYDSPFDPNAVQIYRKMVKNRLTKFFENNRYDFVLANFRPNLKTTKAAKEALSDLNKRKFIRDYAIIPDDSLYKKMQIDGFGKPNGVGSMFPDLHAFSINHIESTLSQWVSMTQCQTDQNTHNNTSTETIMNTPEVTKEDVDDIGEKLEAAAEEQKDLEKKEKERVAKLTEKHSDEINEIEKAIDTAYKSGQRSIIDYISLGNILLKYYKILGPKDLYAILYGKETPILSESRCRRYIALVLHRDCKTKTNMSKDDLKALKADERLTKLTVDQIKNLRDPSQEKIKKMKMYLESDDEFDAVINGDDSIYIEKCETRKPKKTDGEPDKKVEITVSAKVAKIKEYLGDHLGSKVIDNLIKATQIPTKHSTDLVMGQIKDAYKKVDKKDEDISELNEKIEELEKQVGILNKKLEKATAKPDQTEQ